MPKTKEKSKIKKETIIKKWKMKVRTKLKENGLNVARAGCEPTKRAKCQRQKKKVNKVKTENKEK